jgi:ribosomal protein S16
MRPDHCSSTIALAPVMATLIALLTTTVTMAAPAPPTLESYKAKYEASTFAIDLEHQKFIGSLSDSYAKAIESSIETLRAKGDPEPVLKAGAERARFAIDGTVPNPPNEKLPQLIQDMQSKYHEVAAAAETDRDGKLVSLIGRYVPAINRLMHQYTTERKMSLAMEVKAEKERVGFILADIGSRQPSPLKKETGKPELLTSTIILSGISGKS